MTYWFEYWVFWILNHDVKCTSNFSSANWNSVQTNYCARRCTYWKWKLFPQYDIIMLFFHFYRFCCCCFFLSLSRWNLFFLFHNCFPLTFCNCIFRNWDWKSDELIHDDSMIKPSDEVKILSLLSVYSVQCVHANGSETMLLISLFAFHRRLKSIELFCKRLNCHNTATNSAFIDNSATNSD